MVDEYLTINELAARLKYKPDTIREKMRTGIFTQGVHYFHRKGMRPLFKWGAVVEWIESEDRQKNQGKGSSSSDFKIPMRRGGFLGTG